MMYCNGCKNLDPQEEDQTDEKEPHMYKLWGIRVLHFDKHPLIIVPTNGPCNHYDMREGYENIILC